ncbi:MAG TPA: response regulator, partial [Steroidobacteraceae bacterium]|nr:response regulator [Steroidobacteraceae bacterium]
RGRVLVGCRRRRDGLEIQVHDTGIGIESEHLPRIFEEYYQVPMIGRPPDVGIGLGLSIVHRIARLLSLECTVRSKVGVGSCFAVRVPYGNRDGGGDVWSLDSSRKDAAQGLTVVVIDDHSDVLQAMAAILGKWGHHAVTAATAIDAIVQLIGADRQPDIVISDYHLAGGVKGDEAIRELRRELDAKVPALIMTSDPDHALRDRLQRGGLTVLPKPMNLGKLRAMLESLRRATV